MIKVLIIDDEPIVRAGLKKIIPWAENGFEVCGEGKDFDDGIAKINDLKPDIVLTDIKMPGHFGTELMQKVVQDGFKGKFIIVSGYSDFEYAKAAIKYGVKSYILKPIDEDELLDVLLSIKNEIESEKSVRQLELGRYILTQEGNLDIRYFNYDTFKIALFHCSFNDENGEKYNLLYKIIKKRLASDDDIDILRIDGIIAVLFKGFNKNRMMNTIKSLHCELSKEMNEDIFITIGDTVNHYRELIKAYKSAKSLIKYEFLYLDKGILSNEILNENIILDFEDNKLNDIISKIFSYTEVNDLDKLNSEFQEFEKYILKMNYSGQQIKIMCVKICLEFKDKIANDYEINDLTFMSNEEIMNIIHEMKSLKGTLTYMEEIFEKVANEIGSVSSESIIKRVTNYMEKNYYKDLKLETLAGIFNYNSAYLGKLFKSVVGENFNTYLDKIRIEKAKSLLLEEKIKVYQICEKVGYKNIDYFHSKFKKYVGMSPLNYKKQHK